MNRPLLLTAFGSAVSLGGFALAQSVPDDIDLAAIRAAAAEHAADAEALATNVRERAAKLAEDARETQHAAHGSRAAYADAVEAGASGEVLDFDAMVRAQSQAERASLTDTPRFVAFASLSMPPQALKALVRDMARAGGVTVMRGFPQGDSEGFKRRLAAIWSDGNEANSLGIDPRLFRAFRIEAVPSFVMLGADFSPCDGFACTDQVPPHDRISGNVSVAHVLETFSSGHGPGAALAANHLARLEGERR